MTTVVTTPPTTVVPSSSPSASKGRTAAAVPRSYPSSTSCPTIVAVATKTKTTKATNSERQIKVPESSQQATTQRGAQSSTKRVTIELSRNVTHVLDENLCHYANDIWYDPDHFVTLKAAGKSDAREGRRLGLGALLAGTFAVPVSDAQDRISAYCSLDGLEGWDGAAGDDVSRRGLERSLSRKHGDERSENKDRARRAVLIHQASLIRQGAQSDAVTERLAAVYGKHCRSAKLFARRFGIGDELAVTAWASNSSNDNGDNPDGNMDSHLTEARRVLCSVLRDSGDVDDRVRAVPCVTDDKSSALPGWGLGRVASRRLSNASNASSTGGGSVNSYDSHRRFCGGGDRCRVPPIRTSSRACPLLPPAPTTASPTRESASSSSIPASNMKSPSDELYVAAIA